MYLSKLQNAFVKVKRLSATSLARAMGIHQLWIVFVKIAKYICQNCNNNKMCQKYICEDGALISSSSSLALALQHYALATGDPSRPHLDASSHLLFLSSPHLVLQRLWNAIFSEGSQQFLLHLTRLSRWPELVIKFVVFFGTCLVLSETCMLSTSD